MVHAWQGKYIKWKSKDNNVRSHPKNKKTNEPTNQPTNKRPKNFFFLLYVQITIILISRNYVTLQQCVDVVHLVTWSSLSLALSHSVYHHIASRREQVEAPWFEVFIVWLSEFVIDVVCLPARAFQRTASSLTDGLPVLFHFPGALRLHTHPICCWWIPATANNDNIDKCEEKQQHVCWHKILYQTSSSTRNIQWFPPT